MKLKINWNDPILSNALSVTPGDLDRFYLSASETDRLNLFFVLLGSYHACEDSREGAHLCFLMAYYLFVTLTPPGSQALALHYIRRAIALDPREEYETWLTLMEKGN
ncbi:MAG: hypothetical protein Q4F17_06415 [Eubacteriales bacterium]|nr:hypothetical protein [Eubacteriales bacterium]